MSGGLGERHCISAVAFMVAGGGYDSTHATIVSERLLKHGVWTA